MPASVMSCAERPLGWWVVQRMKVVLKTCRGVSFCVTMGGGGRKYVGPLWVVVLEFALQGYGCHEILGVLLVIS